MNFRGPIVFVDSNNMGMNLIRNKNFIYLVKNDSSMNQNKFIIKPKEIFHVLVTKKSYLIQGNVKSMRHIVLKLSTYISES